MPSAGVYRSVFAWDSGWHYFWLKELDPARAEEELLSLCSCADSEGRLPHETPLPGPKEYSLIRRTQLALLKRSFASTGASWFIDPPSYLVAAADYLGAAGAGPSASGSRWAGKGEAIAGKGEAIAGKGEAIAGNGEASAGKGEAFAKVRDGALAALAWIEGNRRASFIDPAYGRFPALLHNLESGTDYSPSFDSVWGRPPFIQLRSVLNLPELERMGYSLKGATGCRLPLLFDPCFLALWLGSRRFLLPGRESEDLVEDFWRAFYDPEAGLFRQRAWLPGRGIEVSKAATFSSLLPFLLFVEGRHGEEAKAGFARNGLPGRAFWEAELPSFNPGRGKPEKSLWRGACSWMNMLFCHASLLSAFGYDAERELLVSRVEGRLSSGPAWEFLDPAKLGGGGASPFSWNGLLLCMRNNASLCLCPPSSRTAASAGGKP
jgi:hypothetical protein